MLCLLNINVNWNEGIKINKLFTYKMKAWIQNESSVDL